MKTKNHLAASGEPEITVITEDKPRELPGEGDAAAQARFDRFAVVMQMFCEMSEEFYGEELELDPADNVKNSTATSRCVYSLATLAGSEEPVGFVMAGGSTIEAPDLAYLSVYVRKAYRRHGFASVMLSEVREAVSDWGLKRFYGQIPHPETGATGAADASSGESTESRVSPVSAPGSVPKDAAASFALAHGAVLKQVSVCSEMSFADRAQTEALLQELSDVLPADNGEYKIIAQPANEPVEKKYFESLATCFNRMASDTPAGDSEEFSSDWTAERVEQMLERRKNSKITHWISVAVHVPTDEVVAYCTLFTSKPDGFVLQDDLLVLREHRGNRLGIRLKIEAYKQILAEDTDGLCQGVRTWNAVENEPVLRLNKQMRFQPVSSTGSWEIPL
ncbi:MAG: GNAT family N-acetyltransferase [Microbacteriaceae bacterium]|nr:GNAT family N-acetyltransferase [Microbacteriaceae bacterium]